MSSSWMGACNEDVFFRGPIRWALILGVVLIFLSGTANLLHASGVGVWDTNTASWTTNLPDGDPIDNGAGNVTGPPQLAISPNGVTYVIYYYSPGLYLNRYDGTEVSIWDRDTVDWTTTLSEGDQIGNSIGTPQLAIDDNGIVYFTYFRITLPGHIYFGRYDGTDVLYWDNDIKSWAVSGDPIDNGGAGYNPKIAIDSSGVVYIAFTQTDGVNDRLYLSRYDGTDVSIWDNDIPGWTTTFADGDPIDIAYNSSVSDPQIAIDINGVVYITYIKSDTFHDHVWLNRYDGTDIRAWDHALGWTDNLNASDPISIGSAGTSAHPRLAIDVTGDVYIAYDQYNLAGTQRNTYLSRYNGLNVGIWDTDTTGWTTTLADGDPVDNGGTNSNSPELAIDNNGRVYVTYRSAFAHLYLSRYNGADVRIWDNETASWTTTFADGDPIDTGLVADVAEPHLAIDPKGMVYVTYTQRYSVTGSHHVYISRYDNTDVRIWDKDTASWTTTFADGDPISVNRAEEPRLAIDSTGEVFIAYEQYDPNGHIYLSRYLDPTASNPVTPTGGGGGGGG